MAGRLGETLQQPGDNPALHTEFNSTQLNFGPTQNTYRVPGPTEMQRQLVIINSYQDHGGHLVFT